VEAARVAILVKDVVHAFAHQFTRPQVVLGKTNDLLLEKRIPGFVTVFLGILDPETGVLKYSSAGHPPVLLRNGKGDVEALEAPSAPVGIFPGHSWKEDEVQLEKEDLLLLYTDGVTEARRNGGFFGQEGLSKALARWTDPSPESLPQALLDEVLSFSGDELADDVAMLAVSLTPDVGRMRAKKGWRQEKPLG
jgi:phosphoserine phosphatase RsbU/P